MFKVTGLKLDCQTFLSSPLIVDNFATLGYSLFDSLESGESLKLYMYIPKSVQTQLFALCGGKLIDETKTS